MARGNRAGSGTIGKHLQCCYAKLDATNRSRAAAIAWDLGQPSQPLWRLGPGLNSRRMSIERFIWTSHALRRLDQRRLVRSDVEQAIRDGHDGRQVNDGQADWLIEGITAHGVHFEAA